LVELFAQLSHELRELLDLRREFSVLGLQVSNSGIRGLGVSLYSEISRHPDLRSRSRGSVDPPSVDERA